MSVRTLARRDVLDPYRSRSLWVILGLFVVLFGLVGYATGGFVQLPYVAYEILALLGPLTALAIAYDSIAGPRENGALRVLLSYPYARREVVLGRFAGRCVVMGVAITAGVLTGLLVSLVSGSAGLQAGPLLTVWALSLLLAVTIVAVTIGISASVASSTWAAVIGFGAYLLFSGFWGLVPTAVRYVLNGFSLAFGPTPTWQLVWDQLNPVTAFRTATQGLVSFGPVGGGSVAAGPFYTTVWFAVAVLVGWILLSLVLGIARFERADL